MTSPYLLKIFTVKTFADFPETAKFAKVFTHEKFMLYGITQIEGCGSNDRQLVT